MRRRHHRKRRVIVAFAVFCATALAAVVISASTHKGLFGTFPSDMFAAFNVPGTGDNPPMDDRVGHRTANSHSSEPLNGSEYLEDTVAIKSDGYDESGSAHSNQFSWNNSGSEGSSSGSHHSGGGGASWKGTGGNSGGAYSGGGGGYSGGSGGAGGGTGGDAGGGGGNSGGDNPGALLKPMTNLLPNESNDDGSPEDDKNSTQTTNSDEDLPPTTENDYTGLRDGNTENIALDIPVTVDEPAPLSLLLIGAAGLILARARRKTS